VTLDLDRYFQRIAWTGATAATMPVLAGLLRAHMVTIPFENLDILLGTPVSLDLDALQDKLVDRKRGGCCYEHATLFQAVIERLGFEVRAHDARVTMLGTKATSARTHMLLTVELPEGAFVLDPGFGGLAPLVPVPLDGQQAGDHWLERDAGEVTLKVRTPDKGIIDAWVTTLAPLYPIDFVVAAHYTSTSPRSGFTQRMMLRAFTDEGRVAVMNRDVTRWDGDVPTPSRLADRAALHDLLVGDFGFDLDVSHLRVPSIPEWSA
jgi:N-hydroxyarylamine O-acetyltransferase